MSWRPPGPIRGLPWFVLEVLGILLLWSLLLNRTKPGRYMYAIGGNREAARRAGVNTKWIRTLGFTLCSLNGGIAGLIIAGQFRGVSTSVDGGQLVLYSIAAAVIGGTSLFGGRGKAIHGVIGGLGYRRYRQRHGAAGNERTVAVRDHRSRAHGGGHRGRHQQPPGNRKLRTPPERPVATRLRR